MIFRSRRQRKDLLARLAEAESDRKYVLEELILARANNFGAEAINQLESRLSDCAQQVMDLETELSELGSPGSRPAPPAQTARLPIQAVKPLPAPPVVLHTARGNPLAEQLLKLVTDSRQKFDALPSDLDRQVAEALDQIAPVLNSGSFPSWLFGQVNNIKRQANSKKPPLEFFEAMRGLPTEIRKVARRFMDEPSPK